MARAERTRLPVGDPSGFVRRNFVPLVLIPLAALLVWVAIWKVWLPRPVTGGTVGRTVTTIDANAPSGPTHKVTTVVRTTTPTVPSRRSETLAIVLLFLGVGVVVISVFHDRIGSIELDRTGIKIGLTKAEQAGAAQLVGRLARSGTVTGAYGRALGGYLRAVAALRPAAGSVAAPEAPVGAAAPGLSAEQALVIADRIADRFA